MIPRTMTAAYEWARAQPGITSLVGGPGAPRVYIGLPPDSQGLACLQVDQVDAGPAPIDAPIQQALIQFAAWGPQAIRGTPDGFQAAEALGTAVAEAVEALTCGMPMSATAEAMGAEVESGPRWRPAPDTNQARFIVDVRFVIRSVNAA